GQRGQLHDAVQPVLAPGGHRARRLLEGGASGGAADRRTAPPRRPGAAGGLGLRAGPPLGDPLAGALIGVRMGRSLGIVLAVLGALALATYVAGEQNEVAVLRTVDASGATHETKLWVVDLDGTPWVRVARPRRAW